jgi:hypothetical protein
MESVRSELTLGYLDDVATGGDAVTVETRAMFTSDDINLAETSASKVLFLGAPLPASSTWHWKVKAGSRGGYHCNWN